LQSFGNCLQYSVDVLYHVIVPEAQDAIAMIAKPLIANGIAFTGRVLSAVDFNDQALLPADQIDNIGTDGFLTYEFHSAERSRANTVPKPLFRNSGSSAKLSR
jgi:hypothetical protein